MEASIETTVSRTTAVANAFNNLLSMDAATIDTLARAIVQEVQDGNKDALEVLIYAKKGAQFFKSIDDNVKSFAYSKQYASKGEEVVRFGCKVELAELGVKYDYQSSGDTQWVELNQRFETAKKAKEDREKFIKSIKGTLSVNDPTTGEVIDIREPVKSGQMGYKITIK